MRLLLLAVLTMAGAAAVPASRPDIFLLHFELSRSAPTADETAHHVAEIRLWFSGEPEPGTTSIRLVNAAGAEVKTGEVVQDEKDARILRLALPSPLGPGAYRVSWRALGDDGHVVRGEFGFTVAAH